MQALKDLMSGKHSDKVKAMYKDSPVDKVNAEDKLTHARLALLSNFPFFGKVSLNMPFVESKQVPTTAVDAKGRFYWNRRWVNGHTTKEMMFEIGHEVMHIVQRCFDRKPEGANHGTWNLAADWFCDTYLAKAGLEQSPISKLMVPEEIQDKAMQLGTIEEAYAYLLQQQAEHSECEGCKYMANKALQLQQKNDKEDQEENKKINADSVDGEGEEEENSDNNEENEGNNARGGDSENEDEAPPHTCGNLRGCCAGVTTDQSSEGFDGTEAQKWSEVMINAKEYAQSKGRGNLPGTLFQMIEDITKSRVRWEDYLRKASTQVFGRGRYSFKRANRRGLASGLRLPYRQPETKAATVWIDTSGSVSDDELRQTLAESLAIMEQCGADKILVGLHDSNVYFFDEITKKDISRLKFRRGGTSHQQVFDVMKGIDSEFKLPRGYTVEMAVLFTDLGTCFPDYIPGYEVIWGVFDPASWGGGIDCPVPFGQKIKVPVDRESA